MAIRQVEEIRFPASVANYLVVIMVITIGAMLTLQWHRRHTREIQTFERILRRFD